MAENTYTSRSGHVLKIKNVKPLKIQKLTGSIRARYLANNEPVDPPFYYVETAGRGKQRHYYDEKSILNPGVPEKDKEAWASHQAALERMSAELNENSLNILFMDGVDFDLPADETWIETQELQGIEVPENHQLRKVHYLTTEILDTDEAIQVATMIMNASQSAVNSILQEATTVAESFPGSVENP